MHALVLGATGATGKDLLNKLLADHSFTSVAIFVRRDPAITHQKLTVHQVDFEKPAEWQSLVTGDVAFSCLGTTLKDAGSKEAQWKVDHDYQYAFAKAARVHNVGTFVLVSAEGANAQSGWFYYKMKGALEEAVKALAFGRTLFFKPGPLERKDTTRTGELVSLKVIRFFNKLGLLKKFRPLSTATLAQVMIDTVKHKEQGLQQIDTKEIFQRAVYASSHSSAGE